MGICLIVKSCGGVDTSNATATADKILSGYTVYVNDNKVIGTIGVVGNQNRVDTKWGTANSDYYKTWCGVTNWIWEGWHDGTSGFNVGTLAEHTWDCDIPDTSWCLSGYTYWRNGIKYTGVMTARGKKTWTIGANGTQTIEDGWHDGTGYVNQSIPIDDTEWGSGGATTDIKICWEGYYYTKNRWCYGANTLTSNNIKEGVCIYGVWGSCSTRYWLIKGGQLQRTCTYNTIDSCLGSSPHYDSSLGAFVVYGTSYTQSGSSHLLTTFPRFEGIDYPVINGTTQTGVIHIEYMMPSPTQWARSSTPDIYIICGTTKKSAYNYLTDYSGYDDDGNATSNYRYNRPFNRLVSVQDNSYSVSNTRITLDLGRSAWGSSKIIKATYIYNMWVETSETISAQYTDNQVIRIMRSGGSQIHHMYLSYGQKS